MNYNNIGAKASFASLLSILQNSHMIWIFTYDYFHHPEYLFQHNAGLDGIMAKSYKGFYVGSGLSFEIIIIQISRLTPGILASLEPVSEEEYTDSGTLNLDSRHFLTEKVIPISIRMWNLGSLSCLHISAFLPVYQGNWKGMNH